MAVFRGVSINYQPGAFAMRCVRIVLSGTACLAIAAATAGAQTPNALTSGFSQLIADRYAAIVRGDSAAVHRQLADDMSWVIVVSGGSMGTAQFLAAVSHAQEPRPRFEIDSVESRAFGDVATVTYRRTDHRVAGAFEDIHSSRSLEVFVRRGGHWRLVEHSETWIVKAPAAVTLDSAALNAFVGRYEIGPGFVDDVHREGRGLVATSTVEKTGARLVPVSESAFSPDGVAPLLVFERDATGRVVGYVQGSPDGVVRRARRIP
jgi:ketosteroid isomerase-like protein